MVNKLDTSEHLYVQVAKNIQERIVATDFGDEGRIPNYVQLSEEYGVSMSTIKKAMQLLSDQNAIVSRVGKGTFANPDFTSNGIPLVPASSPPSKQIGLLIRDIQGPYFSGVYQGLAEAADYFDRKLLLTVSRDIHQQEDSLLQLMIDNQIDGVFLTTSRKSLFGVSTFDRLVEERIPAVMIHDVYDSKLPIVDVDNYLGGKLVARQFLKRGLKRFSIIVGETGYRPDDLRLSGFLEELKENKVNIKEQVLIYRYSFPNESSAYAEGYKIGKSLAIRELGIQGIFLFNDLIAMGFQKAVLERGFSIPKDLAVIGFDNIERCSEALVPLTTVASPRKQIGATAFEQLMKIIESGKQPKIKHLLLEPTLIERDSA